MEDKNKKNKNRKDTQLLTVEDIIREEGVKDEKNKTRIMSMAKPEIDIAWMYPDTLYLHGDRGNVMALVRYAQNLGLVPKVHRIDLGSGDFNPLDYPERSARSKLS